MGLVASRGHGAVRALLTVSAAPGKGEGSALGGGRTEWAMLLGVWGGLLSLLLLRGGKGVKSVVGLRVCGGGYWAVTAASVLALLAFSVYAARRMVGRQLALALT